MLRAIADHARVEGGPSKSWLAAEVLRLREENKWMRKALNNISSEALYVTNIKAWADEALARRKPQ
jgi:hypothetical protein